MRHEKISTSILGTNIYARIDFEILIPDSEYHNSIDMVEKASNAIEKAT